MKTTNNTDISKKIIVIHHSADFDGLFCREIARRFLPQAELIGWDYGDAKLVFPKDTTVYVLDLSPECFETASIISEHMIWIDHHKSAIEKFPTSWAGYRIDGVAACRLAWAWFNFGKHAGNGGCGDNRDLPQKEHFINREIAEPLAVQLAGEYDIWDKRNPVAEIFQLGLRSKKLTDYDWTLLLNDGTLPSAALLMVTLIENGRLLRDYVNQRDAAIVNSLGFVTAFAGLKFLALNSAGKGSLQFAAKDVPETGHDALLKFNWDGKEWEVSLYHAKHRTDLDLSQIAVKHGGGGHRGACGFRLESIGPILHGTV